MRETGYKEPEFVQSTSWKPKPLPGGLVQDLENFWAAPADGRIGLSPRSDHTQFQDWANVFLQTLQARGGDFWVRDYDSAGNIKHYHADHWRCKRMMQRETESVNNDTETQSMLAWDNPHTENETMFDVPSVRWPQVWSDDGQHRFNWELPVLRAPWKRLMYVSR